MELFYGKTKAEFIPISHYKANDKKYFYLNCIKDVGKVLVDHQ